MGRFDEWKAVGRKYFENVSDEQFIRDSQRAGIKFISSGSLRGKPGVKLKLRSGEIIGIIGSVKQTHLSRAGRRVAHSKAGYNIVGTAVAGSQLGQTTRRQGRRLAAERTVPHQNGTQQRSPSR